MGDSPQERVHDVVCLRTSGMSGRAIARSLGMSRKTVVKILREHQEARTAGAPALVRPSRRLRRTSILDPYRGEVERLLDVFPQITAQRVFEELRDKGYTGGRTGVKDLVREIRPAKKPEPSLKAPVFGPGHMGESDWSSYTLPFAGTLRTAHFFAYVLCHSRRKRYNLSTNLDLHCLMDGHVEAFEAIGGVTAEVRYDNQKPVVLRWEGPQPIYNPRFVDFATHYEFSPRACRPGHPNDKPKIERSFWELEQSFFNGRRFTDEEDLRQQLSVWMRTISDERVHRKTRRVVREMYEEERPHLRPLPTHPYDTARVVYRLCDIEGFVSWEGNRYSVPCEHVTEILPVRVTQQEVFVYGPDLLLIARHERRPKGSNEDVEIEGHRPARERGADLDQLRQGFSQMGQEAALYFETLLTQKTRSALYHARQVLLLRQRWGTEDLLSALAHAHRFGALENTSVERILLARSSPRRLPEYVAERLQERLQEEKVDHDLTVYDETPRRDDGDKS